MIMTYTREQLVNAMEQYFINVKENPDAFCDNQSDRDNAEACIDYLLELVKCFK